MSESSPLVSVITPTYNRAAYLAECIDSVVAQTYPHWEQLVVDDGSTDDTQALLERYRGEPRLRVFCQPNRGQAVARNHGLREARGEFICFLDSDNRWLPEKLRDQVALMGEHPEVDVLYGDSVIIDQDGRLKGVPRRNKPSGRITRRLLVDNCVSFNTSMSRRAVLERIGGFDESVRAGDDYDLWLRASVGHEFLHVPEVWGEYRVMEDQISSDKTRRFESNWRIVEKFFADNPGLATPELRRFAHAMFYVRRGRYRLSRGERAAAIGDYLRSLRCRPFAPGPWRGLGRSLLIGRV